MSHFSATFNSDNSDIKCCGHLNIKYISAESLGDFLCILTPNTGQLNPLFHTLAEFRPIVKRVVARQSTDCLAANAQLSPNGRPMNSLSSLNILAKTHKMCVNNPQVPCSDNFAVSS